MVNGLHLYSAFSTTFTVPQSAFQRPLILPFTHQWHCLRCHKVTSPRGLLNKAVLSLCSIFRIVTHNYYTLFERVLNGMCRSQLVHEERFGVVGLCIWSVWMEGDLFHSPPSCSLGSWHLCPLDLNSHMTVGITAKFAKKKCSTTHLAKLHKYRLQIFQCSPKSPLNVFQSPTTLLFL